MRTPAGYVISAAIIAGLLTYLLVGLVVALVYGIVYVTRHGRSRNQSSGT